MPLEDHDRDRLRRALALARKGRFEVEPNPPVGCVIERDDAGIVGEGWHAAFGGPHAEIRALAQAREAARGATAYVSLAPCGITGKTPPCADALIRAGVARVVYAAADPNPDEGGSGVARLRAAGVQVESAAGSLQDEGEALLQRFGASLERPRPWVVLKWAMSLDGRIAPRRGAGGAISGSRARRLAHHWRAHADAVLVGIETALVDDPRLTCRLADGPPHGRPQPLRVVLDATLRLPVTSRLVAGVAEAPLLVLTTAEADGSRRRALQDAGCVVEQVDAARGTVDLEAALGALDRHRVRRLLVEGGARIHGSFLRAGLADQVSAFVAPRLLGGAEAVPAVDGSGVMTMAEVLELQDTAWRRVGEDLLLQGYLPGR